MGDFFSINDNNYILYAIVEEMKRREWANKDNDSIMLGDVCALCQLSLAVAAHLSRQHRDDDSHDTLLLPGGNYYYEVCHENTVDQDRLFSGSYARGKSYTIDDGRSLKVIR